MDAPFERRLMMPDRRVVLPAKEEQMSDIHVLAIDLAKRSFQVCATALGGACVDAPNFAR